MMIKACLGALALLGLLATPAGAQKGMGETSGVARQALRAPVLSMAGTITDIRIGPCEHTTGRSLEGVHLIVRVEDGSAINLHLGPKSALADALGLLSEGQPVSFEAFRTDLMPPDAYVATSVKTGGTTIELRDDNLRPNWAIGGRAGGGRFQGRGP